MGIDFNMLRITDFTALCVMKLKAFMILKEKKLRQIFIAAD
jgi:hypothetical protein